MVAQQHGNMVRVSLTLDPIDVGLLDRMSALDGRNRSAQLRDVLAQLRPMLLQTVTAFEAAAAARDRLTAESAAVKVSELEELLPEAQRVQEAYLGLMARIEGEAAAAAADPDPRHSNHGGHTPTPPPTPPAANEAPEVWDHGGYPGSTAEDDD
jgi:hypothetical protein